jgi:predicted Zn-dependent protease
LMGRLLASRGARAEAFAYYRAGTRDDEPEPWIEVAELHLSANDAARAVAAVNHALERSPAHPWALAVLGRALLMEGRRAEAEVVLAKALRVTPRTHDAWAGLARAFDAAGNKGLAATCRARGEKAREQAYTG